MTSQGSASLMNENSSGEAEKTRKVSGQKFESLTELKRGSGQNNAEANRQSFTEQTKTPGSIGAMWDSFTKGTSSK